MAKNKNQKCQKKEAKKDTTCQHRKKRKGCKKRREGGNFDMHPKRQASQKQKRAEEPALRLHAWLDEKREDLQHIPGTQLFKGSTLLSAQIGDDGALRLPDAVDMKQVTSYDFSVRKRKGPYYSKVPCTVDGEPLPAENRKSYDFYTGLKKGVVVEISVPDQKLKLTYCNVYQTAQKSGYADIKVVPLQLSEKILQVLRGEVTMTDDKLARELGILLRGEAAKFIDCVSFSIRLITDEVERAEQAATPAHVKRTPASQTKTSPKPKKEAAAPVTVSKKEQQPAEKPKVSYADEGFGNSALAEQLEGTGVVQQIRKQVQAKIEEIKAKKGGSYKDPTTGKRTTKAHYIELLEQGLIDVKGQVVQQQVAA